jgi:hypothetical protein
LRFACHLDRVRQATGERRFAVKVIKRLLVGAVVILGAALSGAAVAQSAAGASTTPVVYAAHEDGWHPYVKPGSFYFGQGGAPYITSLTWHSWSGASAWGTGKLWTQQPGCSPSYKCPYYSRWVGVSMTTIRWHGGQRYYARMAIEFWNAGAWRWDAGWFEYPFAGATVPFWVFPVVWPYL